jgi:hypothetical protein
MKTKQRKWQGWWLAILMTILAVTSRADNPCVVTTTWYDGWQCTIGSVNQPGILSRTNSIICLGGSSGATVSGTTFNNGHKTRTGHNNCGGQWTDGPYSITYNATNWWEPPLPTSFNTNGTFIFTNKVKGISQDSDCPANTATVIVGKLTVVVTNSPPVIITQPKNLAVIIGNNAAFTVVATGCPSVSYQWYFNGTNLLSGATNPSLTLNNVQTTNVGGYSVVVSDPSGSTNSANALLTVISPTNCVSPSSCLVGWWPGESNADDIVGENNGTVYSGTVAYAPAEVGLGFYFDGGANMLSVPSAPALNFGPNQDFSIEAWISPCISPPGSHSDLPVVSKGGYDSILGQSSGQLQGGYEFTAIDGRMECHLSDSIGNYNSWGPAGPDLRDGYLHHVVLTVARNSTAGGHLYVDGVMVLEFDPTSVPGDLSNISSLAIGSYLHYSPSDMSLHFSFFCGKIDELSIYNCALSSNEIAAVYYAGSYGKCPPTQPTNCVSPSSCLVGWWPGETNANDIVGGNNGTVFSGTVAYVPAEVGLGFYFDGGANRLFVPSAPALNFGPNQDFSIEAWISSLETVIPAIGSTNKSLSFMPVVSKGNTNGYGFGVNGRGVECFLWDSMGNFKWWGAASPDLRDGDLHHVALTVARNSTAGGHLYVDGVMVLQFDPTSVPGDLSNIQPLQIGSDFYAAPNNVSVYQNFFQGGIDELSIYNCALSSNEIAAIYIAGSAGKCPPTSPTNGGCCQVMQNGTGVDVTAISISPAATNLCSGDSIVFTATTTPGGGSVNWSVAPSSADANFTGCSVSKTFTPASGFSGTANIYATCGTNTAWATVTVGVSPMITTQPASQTAAPGATVTFSVSVPPPGSGFLSFQWRKNGSNIFMGVNSNPTLTLGNVSPADAGLYTVYVCCSSSPCCVLSATAALDVGAFKVMITEPKNNAILP